MTVKNNILIFFKLIKMDTSSLLLGIAIMVFFLLIISIAKLMRRNRCHRCRMEIEDFGIGPTKTVAATTKPTPKSPGGQVSK